MRTILKYPLNKVTCAGWSIVEPVEKVLNIQFQNHCPTVWILINSDLPKKEITFYSFVTGRNSFMLDQDNIKYIDTLVITDEEPRLVLHYFYKIEDLMDA